MAALGRSVFTTYLFPFEVTSALLVIAVVGAVVLSRQPRSESPGPLAAGLPNLREATRILKRGLLERGLLKRSPSR